MSFAGMDTGAVDAVAGRLDDQANRLQHVLGDIDRIMRSAMQHWHGHEAQDFHHWWTQQHRPRLVAAASSVHGLAASLRHNADQQRGASGPGHGTSGGDGRGWLTVAGLLSEAGGFLSRGPDGEVIHDLSKAAKLLDKAGVPLLVLGVGFAVTDIRDGIQSGDGNKVIMGSIDLASNVPVAGLGFTALTGLINYSIPVGDESQNALLNYQAKRMFGVGTDELTPSQAAALSRRYEGAVGPLWMISDKMDQSSDYIADKVGDVGNAIGHGVSSAGRSVTRTVSGWFH